MKRRTIKLTDRQLGHLFEIFDSYLEHMAHMEDSYGKKYQKDAAKIQTSIWRQVAKQRGSL
jgi:hypothetical protein